MRPGLTFDHRGSRNAGSLDGREILVARNVGCNRPVRVGYTVDLGVDDQLYVNSAIQRRLELIKHRRIVKLIEAPEQDVIWILLPDEGEESFVPVSGEPFDCRCLLLLRHLVRPSVPESTGVRLAACDAAVEEHVVCTVTEQRLGANLDRDRVSSFEVLRNTSYWIEQIFVLAIW